MNLVNYLQFLEPMQDQITKIYSTMSGIIGVILVFWVLNFIAGLIQRTYSTGKAFGEFYRNYLHLYSMKLIKLITSFFQRSKTEPSKKTGNIYSL